MEEYITDEEVIRLLNEDYITDEAVIKQLNAPKTAEEYLTAPKTFWEDITAPNVPTEFNLSDSAKRLGVSTAVGAGLGAITPVPGGALMGGLAGLTGGIAEEVGLHLGASDVARAAAGMVGGLVPQAIASAGRLFGTKVVVPFSAEAGNARTTTYASSALASDKIREASMRQTQAKLFGKPTFDLRIAPDNFYKTQQKLRAEVLSEGALSVPSDMTVSSVLRKELYEGLRKKQGDFRKETYTIPATYDSLGMVRTPSKTVTKEVPNTFYNSPEFKKLMEDVNKLAKRPKRAEKGQIADMIKILKNEGDPELRDVSVDDVINLIQNGGAYQVAKKGSEPEIKTLISEDMREALRLRFNEYLEREFGGEQYNLLKRVEREEFIARARDFAPEAIRLKFRPGSEEFEAAIKTLKTGDEETVKAARAEWAKAALQHLSKLESTDRLISEYARLIPLLKEAKIVDDKQARAIYNKMQAFDKTMKGRETFLTTLSFISAPLLAVAGAGVAQTAVKPNPLDVFSK